MRCSYRFLCRRPGESGWTCYPVLTAMHTKQSAAYLVKEWTRRDKERVEWMTEECQEEDVDAA